MRWMALAFLLAALPAAAQPRIVSGFAAGGTADLVARLVAEGVAPALGARPVVETRTGANGLLAAEYVARGPADGSVVFECAMGTMTISPNLPGAALPVDPRTALVPVANIALSTYAAVTGARSELRSMADVLAAARARPGAVSFASAGVGSAQHLTGARIGVAAGVTMVHVPYRGAAPAALDIIAGRADFMVTNLGDVMGQLRGGELRLLALGDALGSPIFPDAPRLSATLPGLEVAGWFGLCGPAAMPMAARARWADAVERALAEPALRARLLENGLTPAFEGPESFTARVARDLAAWGETIRAAGIRAE